MPMVLCLWYFDILLPLAPQSSIVPCALTTIILISFLPVVMKMESFTAERKAQPLELLSHESNTRNDSIDWDVPPSRAQATKVTDHIPFIRTRVSDRPLRDTVRQKMASKTPPKAKQIWQAFHWHADRRAPASILATSVARAVAS